MKKQPLEGHYHRGLRQQLAGVCRHGREYTEHIKGHTPGFSLTVPHSFPLEQLGQ